ncbi:MAG: hypothetical protein HUU35_11080, partial [Armatimonadetes bacterium]|nr:hypothetical protein [Armatimonadota bacterium]
VLRRAAGGRAVHLVNSDFAYQLPDSPDIRDDGGQAGARSFLAATAWRMRKTLLLPAEAPRPQALRFFGHTCFAATDAVQVVVSLNGRDLATYPGSQLREATWHEIAVPTDLLRPVNEVVFRVTGQPNGHPDWFALKIDTTATTSRSAWSADAGATWSTADLSLDPGTQNGEFLVRLGAATDPAAVARPEDFMGRLTVRPAREVAVQVRGAAGPAQLLSPDSPPREIVPTVAAGVSTYLVPEVPIYAVLLLP